MYNSNWMDEVFGIPIEDNEYLYIAVTLQDNNKPEKTGLLYILEYYNKKINQETADIFAEKFCKIKEWYISPNKNSKKKFLIQISKKDFFETFLENKNLIFDHLLENKKYVSINKDDIENFFSFIIKKIDDYAKEFQIWQEDLKKNNLSLSLNYEIEVKTVHGNIDLSSKFDADLFKKEVREFKKRLLQYIQENKITIDNKITIIYKDKIDYIFVDDDKDLPIGKVYFIRKLNQNEKIINIFPDVIKVDNKFYLKDVDNFKKFVKRYLIPSIEFDLFNDNNVYTTYKNLKEGVKFFKDISNNSLVVPFTNRSIDFGFKLKKAKERNKITDPVIDKIIFDLQDIYPTLETLEEIENYVINKISVNELISILMKCVGIIDFKFPRFSFTLPKIPSLDIYDLYFYLYINLEQIFLDLIKYFIDKLFDYILGLLRKLCEDAWKENSGSLPNLDLSNIDFPYADINELIKDFIKEVFDSLTLVQICGLLNGEPTKETLDIIKNILAKNKYEPLKEIFASDYDIIIFFKNFGNLIDKSLYCDLTEEENYTDPCSKEESINQLYSQLYKDNHQLTQKEINELNDQRKRAVEDLKNEMNNLASNFSDFSNILQDKLNSYEIELPSKNNSNVFTKTYEETINFLNKDLINIIDNMEGNYCFYTSPINDVLPLPLSQTYEQYKKDSVVRRIIDELERKQPYAIYPEISNNPYSFEKFKSYLTYDYKDYLKTLYDSSNKQTMSQLTQQDPMTIQKNIVDEFLARIEILEKLILLNPLPKQISLAYKFDANTYISVFKEPSNISTLEELMLNNQNIEEYREKLEGISNYILERNVGSKLFDSITELKKRIEDDLKANLQ